MRVVAKSCYSYFYFFTTRAAQRSKGGIVSAVSVCDYVCLSECVFAWMSDNTITPEPLEIMITKFSEHPMVEREAKFDKKAVLSQR